MSDLIIVSGVVVLCLGAIIYGASDVFYKEGVIGDRTAKLKQIEELKEKVGEKVQVDSRISIVRSLPEAVRSGQTFKVVLTVNTQRVVHDLKIVENAPPGFKVLGKNSNVVSFDLDDNNYYNQQLRYSVECPPGTKGLYNFSGFFTSSSGGGEIEGPNRILVD